MKHRNLRIPGAASFVLLALASGCAHKTPENVTLASATLVNATGKPVGSARIDDGPSRMLLRVDVQGLAAGSYGMHLHQTGKCDPPDFTTAGAHWNPNDRQHGLANSQGPHPGDIPNLIVSNGGDTSASVSLGAGQASLDLQSLLDAHGAAIVIHAKPDDNVTDPSGNSGARIICGVFRRTGT